MRLDTLATVLAYSDIMADLLHNRLQLWNRHDLRHVVEDALAVLQRLATPGAIVGRDLFRLIRCLCHLQGAAIVPHLTAGLPACRLAQGLGTADGLGPDALLRRRRATVAGILVGRLVLGKFCFQLFYSPVSFVQLNIMTLNKTAKTAYLRVLRGNRLAHQPHLVRHDLQCLRYVRNLLIHRYKSTKNI